MLNLASENIEVNDIGPNDSYFMGSSGLSDANATYLSAAVILSLFAWVLWKNWNQIDRD
jgi:hypothetical protein